MKQWLDDYFNLYKKALFNESVHDELINAKNFITDCHNSGGKVIIVGNGGSAAIASHFSVDLTKNARIRSVNFNESSLITCFSNDFGYDNWVEKAVEFYSKPEDLTIFISSSGKSPNIINGIGQAKAMGLKTITFSGFNQNNELSKRGDLNFWVDSCAYNIVENTHQIWLLCIIDMIIGKAEYSA